MHDKLLNQSLSCNVDRKESKSERNKDHKKSLVVCDESTISTCSTDVNTHPCSDDPYEGAFSNVSESYLQLLETSKVKHASNREVFNTKENDQLFFPDSSVLKLLAIRRKVTRSLERQDQKSGNNGRSRGNLKSLPRMCIWIPNPASCNNIDNLDPLKTGNHFTPVKSISSANKDHDMDLFRRREDHYGSTYACNDCTDPYPYVLCRRSLVDWMSVVGDKLGILPGTVHLAVMYVDKALSCRLRVSRIPSSRYKILAAACISLAIKYDEVDGPHLPILPQLLSTAQLQKVVTPQAFGRIAERQVLQYLDYNLGAVTPWMVAHHLMEKVISATQNELNASQTLKWTAFFCGLVLQEYEFQRYRPTELAAAICLATRMVLRQESEWCSSLIHTTGLEVYHETPIFFHLWSYFEDRFPEYAAEVTDPLL